MNEENSKDKLDISHYTVCFIDLLGQQEHLSTLQGLPDKADDKEMATFTQKLKETYGVVSGTRKLFRNFFKSFSAERNTDISTFTAEQRYQYSQMTNNPIYTTSLSDSVVAFTSLATNHNKLPVGGVLWYHWSSLVHCSSIACCRSSSKRWN
jgi:hypothetical protein